MRIDFLAAADGTALTKAYTKTDSGLEVTSYPFIKYFNSFSEDIKTVDDFLTLLETHAKLGHCLLKGNANRVLQSARRVGATNPGDFTNYIVIDNDFEDGFDSIESYLEQLSPAFADVSYIFHHSSSAGTKHAPGIRGHIYILLENPMSPALLKQWLIERNLTIPALRERLTLSTNGLGVRWPLDVSTCQNDKLIYIADPVCNGFTDPLAGQRYTLVRRAKETANLTFSVNPAHNREQTDTVVAQLRERIGLKKRAPRYTTSGSEQVLKNPDRAIVTEVQDCGEFVRVNLNGGNSWAYWHYKKDPDLLFNFKDEPTVRLADIDPDYFRSVSSKPINETSEHTATDPFVFRDLATDTYYNAIYRPHENRLEAYSASSLQRLQHFLEQYEKPIPDFIEDWSYVFDPTTEKVVDFSKKWANKFTPSKYIQDKSPGPDLIPQVIYKVLRSICVDKPTLSHFINWLAYVFQTRQKTGTAWIFHGTQGTGKGILFEHILQPIFGHDYVFPFSTQNFEDQFNGPLERTIIMWFDEFRVDDSRNSNLITNKIKNLITETHIAIRSMRKEAIKRRVFNNVIIATNDRDSVPITDADRRFNVAPAQEHRLEITRNEVALIEEELRMFAGFLHHYKVNKKAVHTVLDNEARRKFIDSSLTTVESFFKALREGDLDYFVQFVREKPPLTPGNSYIEFERAIKRWASNENEEIVVTNTEILSTYNYLQNTQATPTKLGRMAKLHRLNVQVHKVDGTSRRGIKVTFKNGNEDEIKNIIEPNIIQADFSKD